MQEAGRASSLAKNTLRRQRRATTVSSGTVAVPEAGTVLESGLNYAAIDELVVRPILRAHPPRWWVLGLAISGALLLLFLAAVIRTVTGGIGVFGDTIPSAWGFPIINLVWWIGIAHAGTLISAILLLTRQEWRSSINRLAEAMTLFAVVCAGLYPILHMGRPWLFYWLAPYPDTVGLFPQFRSPLAWDFFAIPTYAFISLLFWYVGLIPDLATLRDRVTSSGGKLAYGLLALGWCGSAKHWQRYRRSYVLLAAIATALVVSVESTINFDFSVALVPGWHNTLGPPYFVAGAMFTGFALVLVLAIPVRSAFGLQQVITPTHLNNCAKLMLALGLVVVYGHATEFFGAWYGGSPAEQFVSLSWVTGPYAFAFWLSLLSFTVIQALWFRRVRLRPLYLFVISLVVLVGMWFDSFMIIVGSLSRGYLPSSWHLYHPTFWDYALFSGSFGLFFTLFLLFLRFVPVVNQSEVKALAHARGMIEVVPSDAT